MIQDLLHHGSAQDITVGHRTLSDQMSDHFNIVIGHDDQTSQQHVFCKQCIP